MLSHLGHNSSIRSPLSLTLVALISPCEVAALSGISSSPCEVVDLSRSTSKVVDLPFRARCMMFPALIDPIKA